MIAEELQGATGAGVRIALIDSGVNERHSHVGSVSGGVALTLDGEGDVVSDDDYTDHLGHGTALAGIIRAKAPGAELYAVRIFADRLATSVAVLEEALAWSAAHGMHVANVSLGTNNPGHRRRLRAAVRRLRRAGCVLVASAPPGGAGMMPATFPEAVGVAGDERCAWDEHRWVAGDPIAFRAHPRPRPLPGVPPDRNLAGHSFASAHVAARLALVLERRPGADARTVLRILRETGVRE